MTIARIRSVKALVALGALTLALAAAGPAAAEPNQPAAPTKKGCILRHPDGVYEKFDHGETFTMTSSAGTSTFKCNDATWDRVTKLVATGAGTTSPLGGTGTLVIPPTP